MEKQIPGLHNWAAIWMSFPFLLCVLTMAIQDLGGSTCRSTNSFFCPIQHAAGFSVFSNDTEMVSNLKKYHNNNPIPKVKLTAFSLTQRHFLLLKHMHLLCVNIMWFHQLQVTTGQALRWQHCCCLLANNTEEEVQMNPRACRGHVYLTLWPVSQPAVRPLLMVDPSMIFRVTGASVWWAAHFIRDRDTHVDKQCPRWSKSVAESS